MEIRTIVVFAANVCPEEYTLSCGGVCKLARVTHLASTRVAPMTAWVILTRLCFNDRDIVFDRIVVKEEAVWSNASTH
jgi:hypothetical protein